MIDPGKTSPNNSKIIHTYIHTYIFFIRSGQVRFLPLLAGDKNPTAAKRTRKKAQMISCMPVPAITQNSIGSSTGGRNTSADTQTDTTIFYIHTYIHTLIMQTKPTSMHEFPAGLLALVGFLLVSSQLQNVCMYVCLYYI